MRGWVLITLGALVLPGTALAQAARHEMSAIILGNPGEWFGPDQYPKDALAAGRQGRVVATISVDLTGRATGCSIAVSSGTTSLDKTTCDIALEHASFNPATDRRGKPTTSTYTLPVRWVLPETGAPVDATKAILNGGVTDQIVLDADGVIVSCRATSLTGLTKDPCETLIPGLKFGSGYMRGDRRVGSTIEQRFSSTITIDP